MSPFANNLNCPFITVGTIPIFDVYSFQFSIVFVIFLANCSFTYDDSLWLEPNENIFIISWPHFKSLGRLVLWRHFLPLIFLVQCLSFGSNPMLLQQNDQPKEIIFINCAGILWASKQFVFNFSNYCNFAFLAGRTFSLNILSDVKQSPLVIEKMISALFCLLPLYNQRKLQSLLE